MEIDSQENNYDQLNKTQNIINELNSEIEINEENWLELSSKLEDLRKSLDP